MLGRLKLKLPAGHRPCLQGVVGEMEQQRAAAEQRAAEEEEVKAWILVGAAGYC